MSELDPVIIFAAGGSTRIRDMLDEHGYPPEYPKHLLPTGAPNGETLLGRIIQQATQSPTGKVPTVYAAPETIGYMKEHSQLPKANYVVENHNYPLDLLYYPVRDNNKRVLGCAGDFYSDFTWHGFMDEHDKAGLPVSVLAGRSPGSPKAAIYDIAPDGTVTAFYRPEGESQPDDYRNIGAYIFDPHPEVLEVFEEVLPEDPTMSQEQDIVFNKLVTRGLVGAITNVGSQHFNVNSRAEYYDMLQRLGHHAPKVA